MLISLKAFWKTPKVKRQRENCMYTAKQCLSYSGKSPSSLSSLCVCHTKE